MTATPVAVAVQVVARAPVHATEVPERVEQALTRFWPDAALERTDATPEGPGEVVATASGLDALRDRVWELRIIDAFRGALRADGRELRFRISKQAALAGRVAVPPTPHVLGDVEVVATLAPDDPWPDAEHLRWWLCPETLEGEVVGMAEPPGSVPEQRSG